MKLLAYLPLTLLMLLLAGAIWGKFAPRYDTDSKNPTVEICVATGSKEAILYVLVHGLDAQKEEQQAYWQTIRTLLLRYGDVATLSYPAHTMSNADPDAIAIAISSRVQAQWEQKQYTGVVVVGNSMGALLARKAMLYSAGKTTGQTTQHPAWQGTASPWSTSVKRLILLAGMNRGWDLSGQKPGDMRWYAYGFYALATWYGNLTHHGQLLIGMQTGSPFVADLRLEWMRWTRELKSTRGEPEVVQLLGDIDDLVGPADNEDLRVTGGDNFVWLKVRGTGHADILDMAPPVKDETPTIQNYRYGKFLAAVDQPFAMLKQQSEELPPPRDTDVTQIVFIMHGIRDLGEWSSQFETSLQQQVRNGPPGEKLAIASVRYGYFGMGQFLLRRDREKYVRWFMDQYTETLARYPKATKIHFIGHSNGTYLLTSALHEYKSMQIDHLVLGGSVARKEYDWKEIFSRGQVKQVRNYVAQDDWVVALLPRFFETWPVAWLKNDVGSAGFNGFDAGDSGTGNLAVENVKYISGGHAAFLDQITPIVQFLIPAIGQSPTTPHAIDSVKDRAWNWQILEYYSRYLTWTLWAFLIFMVIWLGARMSWAAGHFSATALLFYVVIVLEVLRWS
ncbi:alpha/beta hydrolase [Duganella sp. S19_KUP01_CR8]|uniref:alpha/beta hydrolase n=1 Tax=Duganella sp. S19_KUP01_CR8 TaxID=3025502 RepID=UPI002FCD6BB0